MRAEAPPGSLSWTLRLPSLQSISRPLQGNKLVTRHPGRLEHIAVWAGRSNTTRSDGAAPHFSCNLSGFLAETPAHGNWVCTGLNQAAYTFVALFSNLDGSFAGTSKTVGKLQYDPRADTWSGPFEFYAFGPTGDEVVSYPGMINATRIAVEMLD